MEVQRTFVMIKPDGVMRGLIGEIISRIERKGLKIVGMKMKWLSKEEAEKQYAVHKGKPFYDRLIKYVTSGPVVLMVVEGENVVEIIRRVIGPTNGAEAPPGTIRGDFSLNISRNVVHASDSEENAKYEISIYFKEEELLKYKKPEEDWIYEQ